MRSQQTSHGAAESLLACQVKVAAWIVAATAFLTSNEAMTAIAKFAVENLRGVVASVSGDKGP